MHNLGQTRSSQKHNHLLLTPDTFVRTTLPGMKGCAAIVHAGPAMGAQFAQYTAEFESGGELGETAAQRREDEQCEEVPAERSFTDISNISAESEHEKYGT